MSSSNSREPARDVAFDKEGDPKSPLELVRGREMPALYIVDEAMRVVFSTAPERPAAAADLPDELMPIVGRLREDLAAGVENSAIGVISPTELVRLQRLDGRDGTPHYAVFRERFATRNSVDKAVSQFKLSSREAEVLDGLLSGDATSDIAARLGIGETTVLEHVRNIGRKMNVTKRSAIVALVFSLR